jgi:hypothetical protein
MKLDSYLTENNGVSILLSIGQGYLFNSENHMNPVNNYAGKTQRYFVNSRASLAASSLAAVVPFLLRK